MSSYLGRHADYYDVFYAGKDYAAESAFVDRILRPYATTPGRRLLELACGTGSHALNLEALGWNVVATDYSEDMLRVARDKAMKAGSRVTFHREDMRAINPTLEDFDAAIALFDSIGYVADTESVLATLAGVRRTLRKGGVFLFEFWHAAAMLRGFDPVRVRRWQHADGQLVRISETSLDVSRQVASVSYEILDLSSDGRFERLRETQVNRFFSIPEMQALVTTSGLVPRKFYAGFTESEHIDDSVWHVVAVAENP